METMKLYEGLFLVDSALAASGWEQVNELIEKILHRSQAQIVSLRKWDERKLAYPIQGAARGTYLLAYFHCEPGLVRDIERDVQLSEQVLRTLILRTDRMSKEMMEKPTPAMLMVRQEEVPSPAAPVEASPASSQEDAPAVEQAGQ